MTLQRLNSELNPILDKGNKLDDVLLYSDKGTLHFKEKTVLFKIEEFLKRFFGIARTQEYDLCANLLTLQNLLLNEPDSITKKVFTHLSKKIPEANIHIIGDGNKEFVLDVLKEKIPFSNIILHDDDQFPSNEKVIYVFHIGDDWGFDDEKGKAAMGRGLDVRNNHPGVERVAKLSDRSKVLICFTRIGKPFEDGWNGLLKYNISEQDAFPFNWDTQTFLLDPTHKINQSIIDVLTPTPRGLERDSLISKVFSKVFS